MDKQQQTMFLVDEQATLKFGASLAKGVLDSCVTIFLNGKLGAGKTTLVRGFLQGLGHQGVVKSPTYTLVEPYNLDGKHIYHFDLYRLVDPEELDFIGARDYFSDGICLIEWPEKGKGHLPKADIDCFIDNKDNGRNIVLSSNSNLGKTLLSKIKFS